MKIYLVYVETSDQCGTSELYRAFKNKVDAKDCSSSIKYSRSYIKEILVEGA